MSKTPVKKLNKWQVVLSLTDNFERHKKRKQFIFGIFNIHTFPKEGEYLTRRNYKGFLYHGYWIK